ncbi:hypothetical protein RhiirA4_476843 [Rhizophagus irregularis]|uniref:Uncharacterized protein n=1 Tax=Rhizophagus irregularis TaxID=588596 RepID=A0A2I1HCD4_9GLOM|nr:hypothetical protein RhiirA4_476843 [Rhizophagus irregularis]
MQIFPILKDISSSTLISIASDYINYTQCMPKEYDKQFRHYTNLLSELIIKEGAKVMFLTNKLFSEPVEELCNGSIAEPKEYLRGNQFHLIPKRLNESNELMQLTIYTYCNGRYQAVDDHLKTSYYMMVI